MASITVQSGQSSANLSQSQLVIVGKANLIKNLSFDDFQNRFDGKVAKETFDVVVSKSGKGKTVPCYLNSCHVVGLSETASRHNCPAQPFSITKQLRSLQGESPNLNVVLVSEYANVFASVCAIARAFPLYSRKTETKSTQATSVTIELVVEGGLKTGDVELAQTAVEAVRTAGRLVDTPCCQLNTNAFVEEARAVADALGADGRSVSFHVICGEGLKEQGFGGIYHVGKAAAFPPAMVVLSWKGESAATANDDGQQQTTTVSLVGKGIVFDTGGTQLKTKSTMPTMKRDMGGAAGVLAAFYTLVKAGFKYNLHCVLCIAENMIGAVATKPDDIITMLSGKTVEINSTDAEGRLVLADGVFYAAHTLKSDIIVDMATLTGAQQQATGKLHAAILSNSEQLETRAEQAGRFGGDLVHPMPFAPELHFSDLTSSIADMKNATLGSKQVGPPSAVAGLFIHANGRLPSSVQWLHVDMASPVATEERGTGYGVALLTPLFAYLTDSSLIVPPTTTTTESK